MKPVILLHFLILEGGSRLVVINTKSSGLILLVSSMAHSVFYADEVDKAHPQKGIIIFFEKCLNLCFKIKVN